VRITAIRETAIPINSTLCNAVFDFSEMTTSVVAVITDVMRDGNQMTLAIVGGFGLGGCEAYPGVFGIFAGFADDAKVENGYIKLPDRPGIGFEAQNALYGVMRELTAGA